MAMFLVKQEIIDMPYDKILGVNLNREENDLLNRIVGDFDPNVEIICVANIEDKNLVRACDDNLRLVILRVDPNAKRVDQKIRRLKQLFRETAPLLLLIPSEAGKKLNRYLRAGADDYWILPMDDKAFASRLYVLLEWGDSVVRKTRNHSRERKSRPWNRFVSWWQALRDSSRATPAASTSGGSAATAPHGSSRSDLIGGKWSKQQRLGFGSFGEVWLVHDAATGDAAVAKIPHSKKLNSKFLKEAAILRRLRDHPNAVELIEILKEDDKVVLIQEYVEGSTLQELLDEGIESRLKESAYLQLVDVVAYAHGRRIMHRDIKPENIMITPASELKLLDFGTGKDLSLHSISSTVVGSRPYMAPEQIIGKSRVASDVWALGVILYVLATECLPFYAENEKELMDAILDSNPEPPSALETAVPLPLETIILKCLKKDWEQRYPTAVQLKEALLAAFPQFGDGTVLP